MRPLPERTVSNVLAKLAQGLPSRTIASDLGISYASVNRIRRSHGQELPRNSAGRPKCLSPRDGRAIVRMLASGSVDTAVQVSRVFASTVGKHVSPETVRTALKAQGLKARHKRKKPKLTPRHKKLRLEFATKYQHWTESDWARVIFSDETRVNRLGSDGRKWVWAAPGSPLSDRAVEGTVKFGGGCLMMWGCITVHGVGFACRIDGNMDAELYTRILGGELLSTLDHYGLERASIIFQQDNDPKHTSKMARRWLDSNGIQVLEWPPQSPDLNPIEHAWDFLKRRLAGHETVAAGINELWTRVEQEWERIPDQFCKNLIESMPRRVAAVLKAKGGYTNY
jgi:transposase